MSRQRLGQNFLVDSEWQAKIASYFTPAAKFGEIGPGRGELTEHLMKRFEHFCVFEKDERLVELHRSRSDRYDTIAGDFVDWNFELKGAPVENFSLIGNLPYESGTMIVKRVVEHAAQIPHFVFLLQKEVTQRLVAAPQTRDFGSLTILVQGQYHVEGLDIIPPEAFQPPPKVDSQLIRGQRRTSGTHSLSEDYQKFIKMSFMGKRKTLANVWKSQIDRRQSQAIFDKFSLGEMVRAEEIAVDLWPKLYQEFMSVR